jgi:hypothetical protein
MSLNETVARILNGAVDTHLHAAPDPYIERRLDVIDVARQAAEAGMGAIVFKSHEYCTAPLAAVVQRLVPEIQVFGAVSLDLEVGGLNPAVVEMAGRLGSKVVWFPTFSARAWVRRTQPDGEGQTVFTENGKLKPEVFEILDLIKKHDMVLATGHLGLDEQLALVREARRRGIERIVATHAFTVAGPEDQVALAGAGAIIEHCFLYLLPTTKTQLAGTAAPRLDPETLVGAVRLVGPERCLISTDLGQAHNLPPTEGFRMFVALLLREGLEAEAVERMAKTNPRNLLGI